MGAAETWRAVFNHYLPQSIAMPQRNRRLQLIRAKEYPHNYLKPLETLKFRQKTQIVPLAFCTWMALRGVSFQLARRERQAGSLSHAFDPQSIVDTGAKCQVHCYFSNAMNSRARWASGNYMNSCTEELLIEKTSPARSESRRRLFILIVSFSR